MKKKQKKLQTEKILDFFPEKKNKKNQHDLYKSLHYVH